jgi:hypothetical protein
MRRRVVGEMWVSSVDKEGFGAVRVSVSKSSEGPVRR